MLLSHHINPHRFSKAPKIDAIVFEELAVFDRQHRVNHDFRNLVVLHHLPLRALVAFGKRGDHFRLELIGLQLIVAGIA